MSGWVSFNWRPASNGIAATVIETETDVFAVYWNDEVTCWQVQRNRELWLDGQHSQSVAKLAVEKEILSAKNSN